MKKIKINKIKPSDKNPRIIKDNKFRQLQDSIKESPHFMKLRPVIVNEDMEIIGGNMRYRACVELGWADIPVTIYTTELHEQAMLEREQQGLERVSYEEGCNEFMIKDNTNAGQWDYDLLANDWSNEKIYKWGVDVWKHKELENMSEDYFEVEELEEEGVPSVKDEDYGKFECIMLYENKKKLVELLNNIREIKDIKLEEALMCLVNDFDIDNCKCINPKDCNK